MPSTDRPLAFWKAFTALSTAVVYLLVIVPEKYPWFFSSVTRFFTAVPVEPTFRVV